MHFAWVEWMCAAHNHRCASEHHGEVLTWRQLDILQQTAAPLPTGVPAAAAAPTGLYIHQAQQLLSLIGITTKRPQAPAAGAAALAPLLSQLQPDQRVLLLHYDEDRQELLFAAWNVEGDLAIGNEASNMSVGTVGLEMHNEAGDVAGKSSAAKKGTAAAAASQGPPRITVIGSMPLAQYAINSLIQDVEAYKQQVSKKVLEVTSKPPPAAPAAAAAIVPSVTAVTGARSSKIAPPSGPAAAAGKGSSKDKGSKDDEKVAAEAAWVPTVPVFPVELNQQWQQLMLQVGWLLDWLLLC